MGAAGGVREKGTRQPRTPLHRRHHDRLHRTPGVPRMEALRRRGRALPTRRGRPTRHRETVADLYGGCQGGGRRVACLAPYGRQHGQTDTQKAAGPRPCQAQRCGQAHLHAGRHGPGSAAQGYLLRSDRTRGRNPLCRPQVTRAAATRRCGQNRRRCGPRACPGSHRCRGLQDGHERR